MSFTQYRRRRDDPILAQDWNAVLLELDRRLGFSTRGRGGRARRAPAGDVAFEVGLTQAGDRWEARFGRGLIAGYEPFIGETKISDTDATTGQPPALVINPAKDVDPTTGTGYLYARLSLRNDWSVEKVEPVCLPKPPDAVARRWKAFKLLAFVTRTPPGDTKASLEAWQAVEHNLGWAAIQRRGSGAARHLFWAAS